MPRDLFGASAIAQYRKILIPVHLWRLIKYLKVEEYIRKIVQRKRVSLPVSWEWRISLQINIGFNNGNKWLFTRIFNCPLLPTTQKFLAVPLASSSYSSPRIDVCCFWEHCKIDSLISPPIYFLLFNKNTYLA